jgi:recombination protein RecT
MTKPTTTSDRAREAAGLPTGGKELTRFQEQHRARVATVQAMLPWFTQALRTQTDAQRFVVDGINALRTVPKLVECTEVSFRGALMTAAQLDLRPNVGALGHCWVLPFENKKDNTVEAQFVLGYRGMITVAARAGVQVNARTIYEHEDYEIRYGLDERLHHVPKLNRDERGDPVAHYAICRSTTGGIAWRVISHEEALATRERSPGYKFGGPANPWRLDAENDWPMCRKTVVRRTFPYVATDSPDLAMAFAADDRVIMPEEVRGELTVEQLDGTADREAAEHDAAEARTVDAQTPPDHPSGVNKPRQRRGARQPSKTQASTPDASKQAPPDEGGPSPEDIAAMNAEAARQAAENAKR